MYASVIIPCYNSSKTIGELLDSLSEQSYTEGKWEIIIADNGSTDNTVEVVESYKDSIEELRIIDASEKKGAAYARNKAVEFAQSNVLLFCDSDDIVDKHWIKSMFNSLKKYDIVASKIEHFKLNDISRSGLDLSIQKNNLIQNKNFEPQFPHALTTGLGIKKYLHKKIGGFDEKFPGAEDWDYCWKAQLEGAKLHFEPKAIVHYRHRNKVWDIIKQAYSWGKASVLIEEHYKGRIEKKGNDKNRPIINWKRLVSKALQIRGTRDLYKMIWSYTRKLGVIRGRARYR